MAASYLKLVKSGDLHRRVEEAVGRMESCELCPRRCKVNRLEGEKGICRTGRLAFVSSAGPHFGEEAPLVGRGGSGTIFFTHCNLYCVFCQNFDISHQGNGKETTPEELAAIMLHLQKTGCHNINFVTPSHVVPQILQALELAADSSLNLPIVYNSGGYDSVETLRLLEDVVDIYMPDVKFFDTAKAGAYLKDAVDYPDVVKAAVAEMHRQVGDLKLGKRGVAVRGLLVRHLVMPGGTEDTAAIMQWLADEISSNTYVNVMSQYRPCGKAYTYPELKEGLGMSEYAQAVDAARRAGLTRLD